MQAQAWHYPVPVIFCDCTRKSVFALVPGCRQHWIDLGTYVWKKGSGKVVWGQILASKNHNWEFACYTTSHCFSTYGVGIVCSLNFRILRLKNKKNKKKHNSQIELERQIPLFFRWCMLAWFSLLENFFLLGEGINEMMLVKHLVMSLWGLWFSLTYFNT